MKEEEILTLQKRLTMREERRQSEITRREEEMRKIIDEMKAQAESLQEKYNEQVPSKKEAYEKLQSELEAIMEENRKMETMWRDNADGRRAQTQEAYNKLNEDIMNLEEDIKNESRRLEQLFIAKEKQIQGLMSQMTDKEDDLKAERERTQQVMSAMNVKAQEFKKFMKQEMTKNEAAPSKDIEQLFETGVSFYAKAEYEKAGEQFAKLVKKHPEFAAGYQYLAICEWNLGKEQEAIENANRALELEPHNEELKSWIETAQESKHTKYK